MRVRIPLFSIYSQKNTLTLNLQILKVLSSSAFKQPNWFSFVIFYRLIQQNPTSKINVSTLRPFYSQGQAKARLNRSLQAPETFVQWLTLNTSATNNLRKLYKPGQITLLLSTPITRSYMNLKSLSLKWTNLLNLVYQIFFYESKGLFFLNPLLSKESLFLNWESLRCNMLTFKHLTPLFFSASRNFSFKSFNVFKNSIDGRVDFALVADASYHRTNSLLLHKLNLPLIGLHTEYENPWQNPYSLPNIGKSLLTQYFFVKCCFWLKKTALHEKVLS